MRARSPSQLILPLATDPSLSRDDFVVAPGNAEAVAFIDSWPRWSAPAAALHGPAGCGKTHLAKIWAQCARAEFVDARSLDDHVAAQLPAGAIVIDNVDLADPVERDSALFSLLNHGEAMLLVGREPPCDWPVLLPDLASRFRALLTFSLWAPDDALLGSLARKLFSDRQLRVPDSVIDRMIVSLERSPASIRDFVCRLDQEALVQKRAISLALLRELLPRLP
jgi:chromosomal replication initiation ATPase DnaA